MHVYASVGNSTAVLSLSLSLLLGGQNGQSVQYSCENWLFLQHRGLPGFPRHLQPADEEKPAGRKRKRFHTPSAFLHFSILLKC